MASKSIVIGIYTFILTTLGIINILDRDGNLVYIEDQPMAIHCWMDLKAVLEELYPSKSKYMLNKTFNSIIEVLKPKFMGLRFL